MPNSTILQLLLLEQFSAGKICGSQGSYISKMLEKAIGELYPLKSVLFASRRMLTSECRTPPCAHGSSGSPGTAIMCLWASDPAGHQLSLLGEEHLSSGHGL